MIIEQYLSDGQLIRHSSDSGKMILQEETGIMYSEAIDVVPCKYNYSEAEIDAEISNIESEAEILIGMIEAVL